MAPKRVLALAPHTDDVELGCGGTIARFLEEGIKVHVAAFSTARQSLPRGSDPNALVNEFYRSMAVLGIGAENTSVYDYEVRKLSYFRQEVLEELVRLRSDIQPDMVLLPSASDLHQDHQVLHNEGLRAFKAVTVWGYELPWNHINFPAQAFVTLAEHHIDAKWKALRVYDTQFAKRRPYFCEDFIRGLARTRGVQIGERYAEAFEVMRVKW